MPGGDATGPMGMGPMTGRAAGFCAGYSVPGYVNNGPGRAFGMGFGRGAGFRRGFHAGGAPAAAPDPENEKQALKNQAEYLQMQLDAVKKRLKELSAQS